MKNLLTITTLYLLLSMSQAWSLPPCEGSDWHNCYGTKNYEGEYKGYKYVGEWKSNKRHGQGTFTFGPGDREGDTYEGEFKYGLFHGQGTYTFRYGEYKGDKYVGEWQNDMANGQGTYTWGGDNEGNTYVGEYKDNMMHGQGTYTYSSGNKYVGEYKNDMMHGQGTYTQADGKVWEGQWSNDKWVSGKEYAAGNSPVDVKAGRIKREKKSKEIEQANDNIRIALDALNYTFVGDKKERKTIVLDAENCIFKEEYSDNKFYLNNVILDTIKFYREQDNIVIRFSGDNKVFNNSRELERPIHGDLERVQKAWGVIYSRACKGASAGEF